MNCGGITTGTYVAGKTVCPTDQSYVVKSPGKTILFSPESNYDEKYSAFFTVKPGYVVLIDGYNIPDNGVIYVNRLVVSTTSLPPGGNNCDPCAMMGAYGTNGIVVFRERMRLGSTDSNGWRLQNVDGVKVSQMMISVPGTYELELADVDMLGDMEVEMMEWQLALTSNLPASYFAGQLPYMS